MKANEITSVVIAAIIGTVSPAIAAGGAREDNSDFVVWIFLAFCALIVIGQLLPMLRSIRSTKKTAVTEEANEKV